MNFPPYTFNGNTVIEYGRLFFIVTSNSRKGMLHFVDLEGFEHWKTVCNCEAWKFGQRPCRHIKACLEAIAHWAGINKAIKEEWIDRLMFLLSMGHSFGDALQSPSICELKIQQPQTLQQAVRQYTMPARYDGRRYSKPIDKPKRLGKKKGCHASN